MKYTKQEEKEAKEEYDKIASSLIESGVFKKLKGHWEDKTVKNRFNRTITEKGDKDIFIPYFLENKRIIEEGKNL